tara:strand:- start:123 stop:812 length:690 start_codon:yes stop_codon:yes gene_type:complete
MHHILSPQRQIKSFVLRAGRCSKRQQEALDAYAHLYEIKPCNEVFSFEKIFRNNADTVVEIGFGMGKSLFQMACDAPDTNFLGIEVHRAGVGGLIADIKAHDLKNVRVVSTDAVEVFNQNIENGSLSGVQIFFPDPWPKKKHHKRRLVQPDFVSLIVSKLKKGGFIHCATDWEDYAHHMLEVLQSNEMLKNSQKNNQFTPRPCQRPLTKFERRGQNLGHGIWDLYFTKD